MRIEPCINLVTLTFSEAVIGSHSCSFTFDGEKHFGIAASRIIPWVKLHWRVESAFIKCAAHQGQNVDVVYLDRLAFIAVPWFDAFQILKLP